MEPNEKSSRWIQASRTALAADVHTRTLVTRLAMFVNALRAQQRWTVSLIGERTATSHNDLIQSFVTAAAYTREAINILTGTGRGANRTPGEFSHVHSLALAANVPPALSRKIGRLASGQHPASAVLQRLRNQVAFHWDPTIIDQALDRIIRDEPIVLEEGRGTVEAHSTYTFAVEVVMESLVPGFRDLSPKELSQRVAAITADVADAMEALSTYFGFAITGHVSAHGPTLHRRWFHTFLAGADRIRAFAFTLVQRWRVRRWQKKIARAVRDATDRDEG